MPLLETCTTRYLLLDGGISSTLAATAPVELLCRDDPGTVLEMHRAFAEAGADCLTTNSFSANATRLPGISAGQTHLLCAEAARLARLAAGEDNWVLGSVGPWHHTGDGWEQALDQQVRGLADGGADAILLETVTSLHAARDLASRAVGHDSGLPVILTFAFNRIGSQRFELPADKSTLDEVCAALGDLPAAGFGVNCGTGLDGSDYLTLVAGLRSATEKCLVVRPGADDFATPDVLASEVWGWVRAGANIVGGCCGVTPAHIAAIRAELDMLG